MSNHPYLTYLHCHKTKLSSNQKGGILHVFWSVQAPPISV